MKTTIKTSTTTRSTISEMHLGDLSFAFLTNCSLVDRNLDLVPMFSNHMIFSFMHFFSKNIHIRLS